jgi:hypothetical protein
MQSPNVLQFKVYLKHIDETTEGTFEIVSKPFVQLLSIHFFDKHEDNMKQLTGVFVLMSRKIKKD